MVHPIFNNYIKLCGSSEWLKSIKDHFSFKNKAAESQLKRFKLTCQYKERAWSDKGEDYPDWYAAWKAKNMAEWKEKIQQSACHFHEDGSLMVPIGLMDQLLEKFPVSLEDKRDHDVNRRILTGSSRSLRTPQQEALDIVKRGPGRGLIRMATGVGKTALGEEIIRHYGLRSIFLCPSEPIFRQTFERFQQAFGRANVGWYGDGKKRHSYVTVGIYQSIFRADPEEFKDYHLGIFDEVHHIGAETFFEVGLNRFPDLLHRYGLTADEERGDGGTILVNAASGPVIYSYDAAQAIKDGYLASPTFVVYHITQTKGSFIHWKTSPKTNVRKQIGIIQSEPFEKEDHHLAYKHWVLGNDLLTEIVSQMVLAFNRAGKSVLVLIDEKEHGDKFQKLLPDAGYVYGGLSSNESNMNKFNKRELKTIVATSTLGEGADTVPVDVLINLMGGTRPKQANGRALRNDPDENGVPRKPTALIIDFDYPLNPTLHRHSLLRQDVHKSYVGKIHEQRKLL